MTERRTFIFAAVAVAWLCWPAKPTSQPHPGLQSIQPLDDLRELQRWDTRVDDLRQTGTLMLRRRTIDHVVSGRSHERFDQYYGNARVFGGDVTRQLDNGLTISLFGRLYDGIAIDPVPTLSPAKAKTVVETLSGVTLGASRVAEPIVWPADTGSCTLAYQLRAMSRTDLSRYIIDAHTGALIARLSELKSQIAVGRATGVLGDTKKISVEAMAGRFVTRDLLRPPAIETYDMQGNLERTLSVLNDSDILDPTDLASDSDNDWNADGGAVDAHVYAGLTYDYLFKRFGRRGLDDNDLAITSLVNPVRRDEVFSQPGSVVQLFYANAFYAGDGLMVYGVGLPFGVTLGGTTWDVTSGAIDIVAHELVHGATDFTSQLIYSNESGALNESFSDVLAVGVEFFFQDAGSLPRHAEYLIGEDAVRPNGIRSLSDPGIFGDPDHYSERFLGAADNGGVHTNAGIPNNAFYLAIEGGTNRTSGLRVTGVGGANRDQIEQVFYRAFTQLMPAASTFSVARAATIQAARDLFGSGSAAERVLVEAWTATGVE